MHRDQECTAHTEAARAAIQSLLTHEGIDAPDTGESSGQARVGFARSRYRGKHIT